MSRSSGLSAHVAAEVSRLIGDSPDATDLNRALRFLAKWRAKLVDRTIIARTGTIVQSGPFRGMDYAVTATEGGHAPRLLGCYEASLAPVIEAIIDSKPALLIDVGCAEGYYAVGMSLRMPDSTIWARDDNPKAQAVCATLAAANGVADRVRIGGLLTHADLAVCAEQPTAIICDIEGAEEQLLDPVAAAGLQHADILVEVHEGMRPGLVDRLIARFAASHRITQIDRHIDSASLPDWMHELSDLDRLIALWEWRSSPTPWLWMEAMIRI